MGSSGWYGCETPASSHTVGDMNLRALSVTAPLCAAAFVLGACSGGDDGSSGAEATEGTSSASAVASASTVAPEPGVLRDCKGTDYSGWNNFEQASAFLNEKHGAAENNTWKAENNDAMWDTWCAATHSSGQLESNGAEVVVVGDQKITHPEDGTTVVLEKEGLPENLRISIAAGGEEYEVME